MKGPKKVPVSVDGMKGLKALKKKGEDGLKRDKEIFPAEKLSSAGPEINYKTTKDGIADWNKWATSKEAQMGESPSALCHASARGIGKLAAFMANSGCLNG